MYVRPRLDFFDLIYDIPKSRSHFDSSISLNYLMDSLEKNQYQAALAITGTWNGSSHNKLYNEFGWESLTDRRWARRLIQFYKIKNNYTPIYLKSPIPPPRTHLFGLRAENIIPKIKFNTTCYRDSFYPHSIKVWNNIGSEFRNIASLSLFKANIFKLVRPSRKSLLGLHDSSGVKRPFQLCVGLPSTGVSSDSGASSDTPNINYFVSNIIQTATMIASNHDSLLRYIIRFCNSSD